MIKWFAGFIERLYLTAFVIAELSVFGFGILFVYETHHKTEVSSGFLGLGPVWPILGGMVAAAFIVPAVFWAFAVFAVWLFTGGKTQREPSIDSSPLE